VAAGRERARVIREEVFTAVFTDLDGMLTRTAGAVEPA
jgi:hypothetical protein